MSTEKTLRLGLCLSSLCVVGVGACTEYIDLECLGGLPLKVGDSERLYANPGLTAVRARMSIAVVTWSLTSTEGTLFGVCTDSECPPELAPGGSTASVSVSNSTGLSVRADAPGTVKVSVSVTFDCSKADSASLCDSPRTATCVFHIVEAGAGGGGNACQPLTDFSGAWTSVYQCTDNCSGGFAGELDVTIQQNGNEASYQDGDAVFSGTVCGKVWTFARIEEPRTEDETGTLTLNADGTATRVSDWRNLGPTPEGIYCHGRCTDTLTRVAPP